MSKATYDITNAAVFACTLVRNPSLALALVRQLHPDRHPDSIKLLIQKAAITEEDAGTNTLIVLSEQSTAEEIETAIVEVEKTILASAVTRGARLDLYFEDNEVVVALEMQHQHEDFILNRSLFISAILTTYMYNRGATFDQMKQVRVTFIYLEDPFGYGDCYNPLEYRLLKHLDVDLEESPRIEIYYVHGTTEDLNDDTRELMEYFRDPNHYDAEKAKNQLISQLQSAAIATLKDGRTQEMIALAEIREASMRMTYKLEGKREIAKNLKNMGRPIDEIAKATGLKPDEIKRL